MADDTSASAEGDYPLFLNRLGDPIPVETFEKLLRQPTYRYVGKTLVSSAVIRRWPHEIYEISTIWLGVNVDLGQGVPLFETMIFGSDYYRQYSTESAAIAGHEEAVNFVARSILKPVRFDPYDRD